MVDAPPKPEHRPDPEQSGMALATRLLKQFETGTAFAQLEEQINLILTLDQDIVDDQKLVRSAQTAMETAKNNIIFVGVEGKNEVERKAALEIACLDNGLYTRAFSEEQDAKLRIAMHEASVSAAHRRFLAIRLGIEARISSKNLLAGIVRE